MAVWKRTENTQRMVDNLSILIVHAVLIYVAVRAILLDAQRPWFESADEEAKREQRDAETQRVEPRGRGRL